MLASYHNHTDWSDGRNSPEEMASAAAASGLDEVGLSDHVVLHPRGHRYDWSMDTARLGEYVAAVRAAGDSVAIPVRVGVEVDWFPGFGEPIAELLAPHDFDFLVGSVHEVDDFVVDGSPHGWARLTPAQQEEVHRHYWIAMRSLAESGLFDVAAHLDLTKKFGFYPDADLSREIADALDAIAAADLVVELNTAGWHKTCADAYPTLDILRQCRRRDIPVTLSADAHRCEHLVRDFGRGAERLAAAGYDELARFAGRERRMEPLAECVT